MRQLAARGVDVGEPDARRALLAEMSYYRAHHDMAGDRAGLARLRARCTEVLRAELPRAAQVVPADALQEALLASLRFRPYPEVPAVLAELRAAGKRLVVVSNWDVSLHDFLAATGLDRLVDGVVTSAEVRAAKPDPAIFRRALEVAGVAAGEALHAGDSAEHDVAGAHAAGVAAVLVERGGQAPAGTRGPAEAAVPVGVPVIATLAGLPALAR